MGTKFMTVAPSQKKSSQLLRAIVVASRKTSSRDILFDGLKAGVTYIFQLMPSAAAPARAIGANLNAPRGKPNFRAEGRRYRFFSMR